MGENDKGGQFIVGGEPHLFDNVRFREDNMLEVDAEIFGVRKDTEFYLRKCLLRC